MKARGLILAAAFAIAMPAAPVAQQADVVARLVARGMPADLAAQVKAIADDAAPRGVPAGPLADKAIEGWAKHVPPARIVAGLRQFAGRMAEAGEAVKSGGVAAPSGAVIAAAAEAMEGGLAREQVGTVVRAADGADVVAPGLSVAAALAAQGLGTKEAVAIVVDAMHHRRPMSQLLDLPSLARAMHQEGMSPGEIGHRLMPPHGDDDGSGTGRDGEGGKTRPPVVPPGVPHPDNLVMHRPS